MGAWWLQLAGGKTRQLKLLLKDTIEKVLMARHSSQTPFLAVETEMRRIDAGSIKLKLSRGLGTGAGAGAGSGVTDRTICRRIIKSTLRLGTVMDLAGVPKVVKWGTLQGSTSIVDCRDKVCRTAIPALVHHRFNLFKFQSIRSIERETDE
jgi:hypothetical protein